MLLALLHIVKITLQMEMAYKQVRVLPLRIFHNSNYTINQ